MRTETTRLFKDLLGLQGYILEGLDADAPLGEDPPGEAPRGAAPATEAASTPDHPPQESTMNLFKSLWLLGGLQSIDPRIGDEDEPSFGPTYGNRVASERTFGASRDNRDPRGVNVKHARTNAADQQVAHC